MGATRMDGYVLQYVPATPRLYEFAIPYRWL